MVVLSEDHILARHLVVAQQLGQFLLLLAGILVEKPKLLQQRQRIAEHMLTMW